MKTCLQFLTIIAWNHVINPNHIHHWGFRIWQIDISKKIYGLDICLTLVICCEYVESIFNGWSNRFKMSDWMLVDLSKGQMLKYFYKPKKLYKVVDFNEYGAFFETFHL